MSEKNKAKTRSARPAAGEAAGARGAVARYKRAFLAVFAFSVIYNLLMLTSPLFMLQVYDRVLASGSIETLGVLFVMVIAAYLAMGMLDIVRARIGAEATADLSEAVIARAFGLPNAEELHFHDARGAAISRVAAQYGPGDLALMFGWKVRTAAVIVDAYWQRDERRAINLAEGVREQSRKAGPKLKVV